MECVIIECTVYALRYVALRDDTVPNAWAIVQ